MDSDLADAVTGLKEVFKRRSLKATFGKSDAALIDTLKKELRIPSRIRSFFLEANPVAVETVTPVERIRLIPAEELKSVVEAIRAPADGAAPLDWKASYVVIGESALLGDPYFLDTAKPDPEGDCPVYTAMSGQERCQPVLVASSFAQFLRILEAGMDVATGFGDAIMDDEDEDSFREAFGPKVKVIDPAALRAGHWN